jgi:surface antigen
MRLPILLAAAIAIAAPAAFADRDDHEHEREHEHGRGHARGHENRREEFREGNCIVERKWNPSGMHEKRRCSEPERLVVVPAAPPPPRVAVLPWYQPQQAYVYRPEYRPAQVAGSVRCNSSAVGGVLGGIVGGVLGHQVGGGNGRTLATIGGAVAGVLVGGELGRRMDAADQACVGQVLEVAPVGQRVQWVEGPTQYVVVPGRVTHLRDRYCRPYTLEVHTGFGPERSRGTACRRPDGVWVAR